MTLPVPQGFRFAAVHCGIKSDPKKEDLTLIVCDRPCVAAGVYTQNIVYAAPVELDRQRTPSDRIRALVVNSGNANACTGERGLRDAEEMTRLAAAVCGGEGEQALVMSTGIIGRFLPMEKIAAGVSAAAERLSANEDSLMAAARGILTTDNGAKTAARTINHQSGAVHIAGFAKGAGMIGPKMATMLAVVATDAALTVDDAQSVLADVVDDSFNCISVEGHMSTNDTVLLLASGAACEAPLKGAALDAFRGELRAVCIDLAKAIPNDGEGASHLITIDVSGCKSRDDAHRIAKTIADSALVKTGIAGADPNWGRIVSAAGYAGVSFDPLGVELALNGFLLYRHGAPVAFDEAVVSESLRANRDVSIELRLAEGEASVRFWTSDLTVDYVRFNSDYHT